MKNFNALMKGVSVAAVASMGVNEANAADRNAPAVERFIYSVDQPNIKTKSGVGILYDGSKMVVVSTQCGDAPVKVVNGTLSNGDVRTIFSTVAITPDKNVEQANARTGSALADVTDTAREFTTSGNNIPAAWYNNNVVHVSSDSISINFDEVRSCGSSPSSSTPGTPDQGGGGCVSGCGGSGTPNNQNDGQNGGGGGNSLPGMSYTLDKETMDLIRKADRRFEFAIV